MASMTASDPRYDGIRFEAVPEDWWGEPAYRVRWFCPHGDTNQVIWHVPELEWDALAQPRAMIAYLWHRLGTLCPVCRDLPMPPIADMQR